MTSYEAYKKVLLKVNKIDSKDNISIEPGEFVLIYNEQQTKWYKLKIKHARSTQEIDYTQDLIVKGKELTNGIVFQERVDFTQPDDLLLHEASISICKKGNCSRVIYNREVKTANVNVLLSDDNSKPDFDFEQTFLTLAGDKIQVYKSDFNIDKLIIDYRRLPKNIDIEGYINLDGTQSTNIDPELQDHLVNEILDMCAEEILISYENSEGLQSAEIRIKNNNS